MNCHKFSGGNGGGATPVPISNTVVKPSNVDGTAWEIRWESRKLPGLIKSPLVHAKGLFYVDIIE